MLKKILVVTNNLPGVEAMMEHGRVDRENRYSDMVLSCQLLPGIPMPVYYSVAGPETERALASLREEACEDTVFIGIMTGNWVRIRTSEPRCPVPLVRGEKHFSYKQVLINTVIPKSSEERNDGEIFVVAPLGKIFCNQARGEVTGILDKVADIPSLPGKQYKELAISHQQAARVHLVSTHRRPLRILHVLGQRIMARLEAKEQVPEDVFCEAACGFAPPLIWCFDNLPDTKEEQTMVEFPHERTRVPSFAKLMFAEIS